MLELDSISQIMLDALCLNYRLDSLAITERQRIHAEELIWSAYQFNTEQSVFLKNRMIRSFVELPSQIRTKILRELAIDYELDTDKVIRLWKSNT